MANKQRMLKARQVIENPEVEFPTVLHQGRILVFQQFGSAPYRTNVEAMSRKRFRSEQDREFTFGPATTLQTLVIAADNPAQTKEKVLNPSWLQLGPYVRGESWVAINPPRDQKGDLITDEAGIKSFLHENQLNNGIYLVPNSDNARHFAFVSADTYQLGDQKHEAFLQGGLARGLEYVSGKLEFLPAFANKGSYPAEMYVSDAFKPTGKAGQTEKCVAVLGSDGVVDGRRLNLIGDFDYDDGYAFGVFDSGGAAQKI
jgi:hypothetical protein